MPCDIAPFLYEQLVAELADMGFCDITFTHGVRIEILFCPIKSCQLYKIFFFFFHFKEGALTGMGFYTVSII